MGTLQRIKQYIDYKGITNQLFEKTVGFSNGAFASQLKNNKTIGVNKLENILRVYPEINPTWLLTGEGEMLKLQGKVHVQHKFSLRTDHNLEQQQIPLYNLKSTTGIIPLFKESAQIKANEYISLPHMPRCDGAVFVTGDVMYPLLKSGDIVAYQKIQDLKNDFFWGEMYLISINVNGEEYVAVKYIQKSDRGEDYIKLVSENKHHQPKDVNINKVNVAALIKASVRIG